MVCFYSVTGLIRDSKHDLGWRVAGLGAGTNPFDALLEVFLNAPTAGKGLAEFIHGFGHVLLRRAPKPPDRRPRISGDTLSK